MMIITQMNIINTISARHCLCSSLVKLYILVPETLWVMSYFCIIFSTLCSAVFIVSNSNAVFYSLFHLIDGLEDQEGVIFKFHFDSQHPPAFCSVTRQQDRLVTPRLQAWQKQHLMFLCCIYSMIQISKLTVQKASKNKG